MKRYLAVLLTFLVCGLSFTSCSQLQQKQNQKPSGQEAEPEMPPPLYLGAVHQVFSADKFALLRIIGPIPPEGTVLITHPADGSAERIGNLIVSSAQHARNNIIAADIRAGVVMKGDRVFKYRNIASEPEVEDEEQEAVTLTDTEIDVGYTPPEIKEKFEKDFAEPLAEPESDVTHQPTVETTVLPEAEPSLPAMPETPSGGKFDDIPDTISGWDSM